LWLKWAIQPSRARARLAPLVAAMVTCNRVLVAVPVTLFAAGWWHFARQGQEATSGPSADRHRGVGFSEAGDSCAGNCGTWANTCWCIDECTSRGNCCSDYENVCSQRACPACPNSTYNCDDWIKYDPSKYTCDALQRDFNCDCRGCSQCSGPSPSPSPSPHDNVAKLRLFREAEYPKARCLDGSMAGYYYRKGPANKYLIFLEGGGWCYDSNCASPTKAGTLKDCTARSRTSLGSSGSWSSEQDSYLTGMLSADFSKNPVFHNWTLVYVPYCDGASFSGDKEVGGLHFRGRSILRSLIQELLTSTSVRGAEQVVLSGGSAGASAVYYHADSVAEQLALTSGRLFALPDAGFFLNLPDKDGINCWPLQMKGLFDIIGNYGDLNAGCLKRFKNSQRWKCLYPENYVDLIETPLFALHSYYDSSETTYTLRLDCCPGGCGGRQPKCMGKELHLFEEMKDKHTKAWAPLVQKNGSGIWSPSCIAHTMAWGKWTDSSWEVPAGSGNTMAAVVGRWLAGAEDGLHFVYQDEVAWPKNRPCAGDVAWK